MLPGLTVMINPYVIFLHTVFNWSATSAYIILPSNFKGKRKMSELRYFVVSLVLLHQKWHRKSTTTKKQWHLHLYMLKDFFFHSN